MKTQNRMLLAALTVTLGFAAACGPPPDPGQCDLQLTKSVTGDTSVGGSPTYELVVDNVGDGACAAPLTVSDQLPPGITFQSSPSSNWSCQSSSTTPETVDCTRQSPLPAQTSTMLELEVQVGDKACMSSNCASVANAKKPGAKGPRIDGSPENNRDCEKSECKNASRCVDPPAGMVGWWTSDQTADDRSTAGNHGSLEQGAHYATGQVLESFEFDGDDDHVKVPDDNSLDFGPMQDFSVDAWVHPSSNDDAGYLMDKREKTASGVTGWGLYWKGGQLSVVMQSNGTSSPSFAYSSSGPVVPADQWTHVTLVVDRANDSATLYIDGAVDGTFQPSAAASGTLANNAPLYFGRDYSNHAPYYFDGRLDEIEIFDRALDAGEVQSLVDAGPCGKCRVDCEPKTETYLAGKKDQFGGGNDQASPSQYLIDNYAPVKPFDNPTINMHFGHTFSNLKPTFAYNEICRAKLVIRMRPSQSTLADNDGMVLNFSDGSGNQIGPSWYHRIGNPNGLVNTIWNSNSTGAQTITLDLAALPNPNGSGTTSLIAALDNYAMLNIRVQDDTTIDWAELVVDYCCDGTATDQEPDMAIDKTLDGDLTLGQTSTYTISVDNVGAGEASPPVEITDDIPSCLKIQGIQAPWNQWCTLNGQTISCSYPDPVASGGSLPDLLVDVTPTDECGDKVENCATVENDGDTNADNDKSCDDSVVTRPKKADLSIDKKANTDSFQRGGQGTYTLTVKNNGPDEAQGPITVTDQLPSCLNFASAAPSVWSCTSSGQTVTCQHPGPLPSGQSLALELNVDVGDDCADRIKNCADVRAASPTDPNAANDKSCVDTPVRAGRADLSIRKSHKGDLVYGQTSTYDLTVINHGPDTALGPITVTDPLPGCLTYVGSSPSSWSCSNSGGTVTCTHPGPLASGQAMQLQLEVKPTKECGDIVNNCAKVDGQNDPDTTNNKSCVKTRVTRSQTTKADLSIEKQLKPGAAGTILQAGQVASYDIKVTNLGPTSHPGPISLTDTLPSCLNYVIASVSGASCTVNGQTVTCTRPGSLAASASFSVSISVRPKKTCVRQQVTNCAKLTTANQNATNDKSCDSHTVMR